MAFGTSTGQAGRPSGTIVDALNRDWDELVDRCRGPVTGWSRRHGALAQCRTLADVLSAASGQPDAVHAALLTEVSTGDQLAGRVVLQAMLGRLVRMARRDRCAGIDEYVSACWCLVHAYPLPTRPIKIVANLAMDTLKTVCRERRWMREAEVDTWPGHVFWDEPEGPLGGLWWSDPDRERLTASTVVGAGHRAGVIDDQDRALLLSVYVEELTGAEAADRFWVTPAVVRGRCRRAVRRLAAHADELLEAA